MGHTIQEGCISSDENNVSKILPIRQPQTKRQIRQIIGLVNYYHDFALNYSQLMSPLTELLKRWTNTEEDHMNTRMSTEFYKDSRQFQNQTSTSSIQHKTSMCASYWLLCTLMWVLFKAIQENNSSPCILWIKEANTSRMSYVSGRSLTLLSHPRNSTIQKIFTRSTIRG